LWDTKWIPLADPQKRDKFKIALRLKGKKRERGVESFNVETTSWGKVQGRSILPHFVRSWEEGPDILLAQLYKRKKEGGRAVPSYPKKRERRVFVEASRGRKEKGGNVWVGLPYREIRGMLQSKSGESLEKGRGKKEEEGNRPEEN